VNINEFIRERKEEWERLEMITRKLRSGSLQELSREDLWDLGRLYSAAVSDLSVLRSSELALDPDNEMIAYLNNQVAIIHGMVYRKPRFTWASLKEFFSHDFPETFRANAAYVGIAAAVFILAGLAGLILGLNEPAFIDLLVPEKVLTSVEQGKVWFRDVYTVAPMASSTLMTHNISVTFLMFAAGITFGVGTVYLLGLNGLLVGTVAALCTNHGLALEFWSFLLPHGSLELMAVFIAGGAGLIVGHALIDPGPYRRVEIVSLRSKQAVKLVIGCIPILVIAGLVEAFFSPSPLPAPLKIIFSAVFFAALLSFLVFSGTQDGNSARTATQDGDLF